MKFVELDPASLSPRDMSHLMNGVVVPRPIAWVSTIDVDGNRNLAPHSYFNAVSCEPPIVQFTSTHSSQHDPAGYKDTLRNVRATGEFVINVVSEELLDAMNTTAIDSPPGVDEFQLAGLEAIASARVRPPRGALQGRARMSRPHVDADRRRDHDLWRRAARSRSRRRVGGRPCVLRAAHGGRPSGRV